jgi:O-antigen ligase
LIRKIDVPAFVFILMSVMPIVAMISARSLAFFPAVLGVAGALIWVFGQRQIMPVPRGYALWAAMIAALWTASCFWSVDFSGSLEKALSILPLIVFGGVLFGLCSVLPVEKLRFLGWIFPFCLGLASILLGVELYFNLPAYRWVNGALPDDIISTAVMNRAVVTIVLCAVIGFYFIRIWDAPQKYKRGLAGFLIFGLCGMLMYTQSQSAQMALLVSIFFFFVFPYHYRVAYGALFIVIGALILFSPWFSQLMYQYLLQDAHQFQFLKDGYASNRIEIWNFISAHILLNPIYGYGLEATKLIGDFDFTPIFQREKSVLHPHNFALQFWIEYGVIGAGFITAFIGYVLYSIHKCSPLAARVCLATFMGVLCIAAMTYGIWQSWWLGLLILIFCFCVLVVRFEKASS